MSITTEIRDIVRKYVPSGLPLAVTLPRSPDRVRWATVPIPPRNGVVTGNQGSVYVSSTCGKSRDQRSVFRAGLDAGR